MDKARDFKFSISKTMTDADSIGQTPRLLDRYLVMFANFIFNFFGIGLSHQVADNISSGANTANFFHKFCKLMITWKLI